LLIFDQLNRNWFLPVEASLKRACIQKLIREILEDRSSTQFSDPYEEETGVEFLEEISSSVSGTGTDTDTGINISVTTKSPMRVAHQQQPGELGLNSRNLFEPGTSARSFSSEDCWQTGTIHGSSCMSPVEVIVLSLLALINCFLWKLMNS
jgi:sentrin-specific protease 7